MIPMNAAHRAHATRPAVVKGLMLGFALVLALLLLAGAVAVREVQEMHQRATTMAEQQRLMDHSAELALESVLIIGACLLVAAASAAGTIRFVKTSIRNVEEQQNELNQVSWHMLQTQEETARRFSHELHDELGQSLAALRANLTKESTTDLPSLRADCLHLVDTSIANVRELSQLLRPVILDDFGLDSALRWLVEGFAQRTRLQVSYESNWDERLHEETETHLFRIAQEAFTNIARHADASHVRIELMQTAGGLRLIIQDNGKGLPSSTDARLASPSLGMVGMRARARQCGGELTLTPMKPSGLRIEAIIPHRQQQQPMDSSS